MLTFEIDSQNHQSHVEILKQIPCFDSILIGEYRFERLNVYSGRGGEMSWDDLPLSLPSYHAMNHQRA